MELNVWSGEMSEVVKKNKKRHFQFFLKGLWIIITFFLMLMSNQNPSPFWITGIFFLCNTFLKVATTLLLFIELMSHLSHVKLMYSQSMHLTQ